MLVDLSTMATFIGPALIISTVFIVGKIVADTVGTFVAGHGARVSLTVGMGMPQVGEFSLAMVKVGAEGGVVGAVLYPVIAVTTALTSFVYPYVFRSADATASVLERRSPRLLRQYVNTLSRWLITLRTSFSLRGEAAQEIRHSGRVILVNCGIIVLMLTVGTFLLRFTSILASLTHVEESIVGMVVGGAVVVICVPPAVFLWRSLGTLADRLSLHALRQRRSSRIWGREAVRSVLRNTLLILITGSIAVASLPFLSELLFLGRFAAPVPALLLIALTALLTRTAFKVHGILAETFTRTFYGAEASEPDKRYDEHEH